MDPNPQSAIRNPQSPLAVGYLRASTTDQRNSLPVQHDSIHAYARFRNLTLPADLTSEYEDTLLTGCFFDHGVSAEKVPFLERPGAIAMLEYMRTHGIKHMVITKLDRAFRSVVDCLITTTQLSQEGIQFHFLDIGGQTLDTSSPVGALIITILAALAKFENERRAERVKETATHLRNEGLCVGEVRYGWRLPDTAPPPGIGDPEIRRRMRLVPVEHEQAVLRRLIEGDLSTLSLNAAARQLNAEGIPTKKGKKWHGATVLSVKTHAQLATQPQAQAA